MKKILISGLAVAVLLGGAIISMVTAETNLSNTNIGKISSDTGNQPTVLEINNSGHVLLRGKIDSVGSDSLTVKSWGGGWTINILSSTKLQPNDITKFQQGDFVGAQGTINQNVSWSVDATLIRDWTAEQRTTQSAYQKMLDNKKVQAAQLRQELIKSLTPKNWQGTASNVNASGNSLTLTVDSTAYTVNLAAGAQLVNKNWGTITLVNISNGDTVRVWGPASSTIITASILRDTSIPAQTPKNQ